VGAAVGAGEGALEGGAVGSSVGAAVGGAVGSSVGAAVGDCRSDHMIMTYYITGVWAGWGLGRFGRGEKRGIVGMARLPLLMRGRGVHHQTLTHAWPAADDDHVMMMMMTVI
jgi:hypothetical protein